MLGINVRDALIVDIRADTDVENNTVPKDWGEKKS